MTFDLETQAYRCFASKEFELDEIVEFFKELGYERIPSDSTEVYRTVWPDADKNQVIDAKYIVKKDDFKICCVLIKSDNESDWKRIANRIIKSLNGDCLVLSHNPSSRKWIFSTLSQKYSDKFSETRNAPLEFVNVEQKIQQSFLEFFDNIKAEEDDVTTTITRKISDAFDNLAIQIHDELTVNVYEALKILSDGIIGEKSNKLELNDDTLKEIRSPIFTLLYRLIFILYAEDREIFPVEDPTYYEEFSLRLIKDEWILKPTNTKLAEYQVQKRLKNLFKLIELGSKAFDYPKFSMRSYYGRLFDREINSKLESWKISNSHLIKTLELLTRTKDTKGNYFFLDYAALDTRHLGAVYEHLLEFHLEIKNKKISELPNPEERKASGSYYTPKYIVDYIVKNSLEPLIKSIIEKNPDKQIQIEKILELKILDPAMGSGHFLVGAVEYIAKRICEIEFGEITEQAYIDRKRDVVRNCIYGIDINPLAVDLASLSLWLETLSSEKPLSFLRSHIKCGNSLIGSEIKSIFGEHDIHSKTTQTTLFESQGAKNAFKKNIKNFLMFENLKDDTPSAVKIKLEEYTKMQSKGTIYKDLQFLLSCKTAEFFDIKLPILFHDYSTKIGENSLDYYSDENFQKITALSEQNRFYHLELEFPQIFYDDQGARKKNGGFDCIIGNPPYIRIQTTDENEKKYLIAKFDSAIGRFDLYLLFIERSIKLLKNDGVLGFITSNRYTKTKYGKELKKLILEICQIEKFIDFGHLKVFGSVTAYPSILQLKKTSHEKSSGMYTEVKKLSSTIFDTIEKNHSLNFYDDEFVRIFQFDQKKLGTDLWNFLPKNILKIYDKINNSSNVKLKNLCERIYEGFITGANSVYLKKEEEINNLKIENDIVYPVPKGNNVRRYNIKWSNEFVIFPHSIDTNGNMEKINLSKYPNANKYFKQHKENLKKRGEKDGKPGYIQKSGKDWYEIWNTRNINWFKQDKIITPNLSKTNNFCVDFADNNYKDYFFLDHDCYGIILKSKKKADYLYILGILNSKLMEFFIKQKSPRFGGFYYKYHSQYMEIVPIIEPSSDVKLKIIKDVQQILKYKKQNEEKKSNELENRINSLVYQIYEIDDDEKKIIEENLN